ncbi:MAG: hypothetical protein H7323_10655 [Frankiales bacterium]|nr:hypothetical protein [Frankiales bacterium]
MRALLRKHPVSLALAAGWTLSWTALTALGPRYHADLLALGSTSLPRLAAWPVTVPVSAVLVAEDLAVWLVAVVLGVAAVEARLGWRRALVLVSGVHIGATILSQGLLGLRVVLGDAPPEALHQLDVGPSYVVIAGLVGAAMLSRSRLGRVAALAALAVGVPELIEGLPQLDLAATGHVAAVLIAVPLAHRLRSVVRSDSGRRSPAWQDLSEPGSHGS